MERERRVYPVQSTKWYLCGLLLLLSLVIAVSGFVSRKGINQGFSLDVTTETTPVPMTQSFDETPVSAEIVLPSSQWYALQLGVFDNEEGALQLAEAYRKRGAAGYLWLDGRHRILAAAYPLREEAQQVREQLRDQHTIDTSLYLIDFPELKLRMNGMQGQLEILQAAFVHAHDLAASLQEWSVSVDRAEISKEMLLEKISTLGTQLDIVALRLKQRYAEPKPAVVEGLVKCFEGFSAFADDVLQAESMVLIGTQLKYQTISVLWELQEVYQALFNT